MKNIVIIGGGTGTFTLLSGLRKFPVNNTVIISSADDGGSTGRLRTELSVMPAGDIRQCLVGLSYTDEALKKLFNYRFDKGSLSGHTVGNILLAALEKITGNVESAIAASAKLLNVRGEVLPVTLFPTKLSARLKNGNTIVGEHRIDEPTAKHRSPIVGLSLSPSAPANPRALDAIRHADAIVFGPGDLFSSTLPSLLVRGVKEAILKSSAKKVFIVNIMTKSGQTDGFSASDFVQTFNSYLSQDKKTFVVDAVIVNTKKPGAADLVRYRKTGATLVQTDAANLRKFGARVIAAPLVSSRSFKRANGDTLTRSFLRHDENKIAKIIWEIVS
ncbi:MAG: gluconeogenesis factor YvcK family protein [Patescibacteria group bacterium]|jgi:uncharacterized cofD-like protein